jgi:hypothetical protein
MTCNTSAVAVCCSSPFTRLGQEPRVLDRDHRLRREVLQQRDLLLGERPDFLAVDNGVIQMAAMPPEKPGLLRWLLFGMGYGPGEDKSPEAVAKRTGAKHAVKCDMCKGYRRRTSLRQGMSDRRRDSRRTRAVYFIDLVRQGGI